MISFVLQVHPPKWCWSWSLSCFKPRARKTLQKTTAATLKKQEEKELCRALASLKVKQHLKIDGWSRWMESFGSNGLYSWNLAVSFRERKLPSDMRIMISHNPGDSIRDLFISRSLEVTWPPTFETVTQNHEKLQGRLVRRIARSTNLLHPRRLTWNLQIILFWKEHDLPNLRDYVPCTRWFNSWSSIINGGHPRNTTQQPH